MNQPLAYSSTSTDDIERIMNLVRPVLLGEDSQAVMSSCLAIATLMQDPTVTLEQLCESVKGASEWIACYLSGLNQPKGMVN